MLQRVLSGDMKPKHENDNLCVICFDRPVAAGFVHGERCADNPSAFYPLLDSRDMLYLTWTISIHGTISKLIQR